MNLFQAVFLGILQGLTEFLPISSSGHLAIFQFFFGIKKPILLFDILLHVATLVSILIFFWKDIVNLILFKKPRLAILIITASVPTAAIGFLFKDFFEGMFTSIGFVGCMLILTGIWLLVASIVDRILVVKTSDEGYINWWQALLIGLAQGIAIAPGISRSGATISTALICGVKRNDAVRFSFILSIPAILGAFFFKIKDVNLEVMPVGILTTLVAMVFAAITGIFSIKFLLKILNWGRLYIFSVYCIAIGLWVYIASRFIR